MSNDPFNTITLPQGQFMTLMSVLTERPVTYNTISALIKAGLPYTCNPWMLRPSRPAGRNAHRAMRDLNKSFKNEFNSTIPQFSA